MTTGALIFAFNNEHVDYLAMARWSAKNIKRYLGIPTAIVTDIEFTGDSHEQVIIAESEGEHKRSFDDLPESVTWYNGNRVSAYDLSPWDRTLVLDADYVVASDQLKMLLEADQDFLAHKTAYDITDQDNFDELNVFGRAHMPMWWATVMMFRRSETAKLIFESMQMIRSNWTHYRNLYGVTRATYRNDYALSIALGMVNGHTLGHPAIPWSLATVTHAHRLKQIAEDRYRVDFLTSDKKPKWVSITGDFHAMGKGQLGEIIANCC